MPYTANVYNVVIASPGDVAKERDVVRAVVNEWNVVHSSDRETVLMPLGWETHATPEMGDRPQAIINKQILKDADILVAVFWTRIGSPTGKYDSGTIEEIEEHIGAGKPAMIYFSSAPVRPESVDQEQYAALRKFKAECQSRGLYESYESISEFREKVTRHIAQTVIKLISGNEDVDFVKTFQDALTDGPAISGIAQELLKEGASDGNGTITVLRHLSGTNVETNGRIFTADGATAREVAKWTGAVDELVSAGLLQDKGLKGEVFGLTHDGFEYADRLGR